MYHQTPGEESDAWRDTSCLPGYQLACQVISLLARLSACLSSYQFACQCVALRSGEQYNQRKYKHKEGRQGLHGGIADFEMHCQGTDH